MNADNIDYVAYHSSERAQRVLYTYLMATTKYGAIADALRARIADGTYPVGTKLPSITELMREFDVPGLNTVRDAQQVLVLEGLLRTE